MGLRYFRVGQETTFGGGTSDWTGVRVRSVDITVDQGILWDETVEYYLPAAGMAGPLGITARIDAALRPEQMSSILDAALSLDAQGRLGEPKSLAMEFGDEVTGWLLKGVAVRSLEFTFEAREAVTVSIDCIAKTIEEVTPPSEVEYSDEEPFAFHNASVYVGNPGQQDPPKVMKCRGCTLTIDRGVADDYYVIGDRTLAGLHAGITNMNGRLTVYASELDAFRKAVTVEDFSNMTLKLEAIRGNRVFRVTAPIAAVNSGSFTMNARDLITREIEYRVTGIPIIQI